MIYQEEPPAWQTPALQLCRPLSEAVIGKILAWFETVVGVLQLCRPLSEAVISLLGLLREWTDLLLQLCRPLSEAVMSIARRVRDAISMLQLCRPLSEAVIRRQPGPSPALHPASIVPPPFGSGYVIGCRGFAEIVRASIVPPPFGSGYPAAPAAGKPCAGTFNCAAPFRKRLSRAPPRKARW